MESLLEGMTFKLQSSILFDWFSTVLFKLRFRFQPLNLMEKRISANGAGKTVRAKQKKRSHGGEAQGPFQGCSSIFLIYQTIYLYTFGRPDRSFHLVMCPNFLSDAVINTTTENIFEEESVYFILHLERLGKCLHQIDLSINLQSVLKGSQASNLEAGTEAETIVECYLLVRSPWLAFFSSLFFPFFFPFFFTFLPFSSLLFSLLFISFLFS